MPILQREKAYFRKRPAIGCEISMTVWEADDIKKRDNGLVVQAVIPPSRRAGRVLLMLTSGCADQDISALHLELLYMWIYH